MKIKLITSVLTATLCLLVLWVGPVVAYPEPVGFVNDFADVLSTEFEESLESELASFSAALGPEVAVVTIVSLEGDVVENYAVELFEEWGIGKKDIDNGVLFLAAIEDRKMRIEVGYGAEALLTDAEAGRIIRDTIAPEFKNEDYEAGVEKGVGLILTALENDGEAVATPESTVSSEEGFFWLFMIGVIFTMITYLGAFLARSKSWWLGGLIGFVVGIFIGRSSFFWLGIIGLILDYILSKNYKKLKKQNKPTGFFSSRGGFWTGGGKSSGGFGGFGGGGSGGGGASGGW